MYIYNRKILDNIPSITYEGDIKVTEKDVLFTFSESYVTGSRINMVYSISYFNIPNTIRDFEISRRINIDSLEKAAIYSLGNLDKYVKIESITSKNVILTFDAKKFLIDASFPTNVVKRKSMNSLVLKLNKKIPEIVKQTSEQYIKDLFSLIMSSIIRGNSKYKKIFSGYYSWYYSNNTYIDAFYDIQKNEFDITANNPGRIIYYYMK